MGSPILNKLEKALGSRIVKSRALPGGDIADVSLLTLENGTAVVAKRPRVDQPDTTAVEAMSLKYLAKKSAFPVPTVLYQTANLLILDYIPYKGVESRIDAAKSVAGHVAALHTVRPKGNRPYYGFTQDTFIGPLPQINTPQQNWCTFFAENRLLAMAQSCLNTHRIDSKLMKRLEKLAAKLPDFLPATPDSSLLHGDLWAGNMLIDGAHVAAFIDPAVSYGHREMDIAFIQLMGGLDTAFMAAYNTLYPLEAGYEQRLPLYQLWPLLVHVRLFGGTYAADVKAILDAAGIQ
ncbi:fructosamine kinase family protein [Kordiimonas pumila]|uniref:Fructosamine kinase family protein n=1 Tax=Kordiimonas pumila TaxID=2161677 RepID=A0ABV7CZS8_9PROT|nr:fructosamine kinase family protein [Kordiimonas pumila]